MAFVEAVFSESGCVSVKAGEAVFSEDLCVLGKPVEVLFSVVGRLSL